jgi:hypothetical protein
VLSGSKTITTVGILEADFELPKAAIGQDAIFVALETTEALPITADIRELSLAFGIIEISNGQQIQQDLEIHQAW